ncbi:hypothetical protein BN903_28 [Halorubrum sp. AJ67]|nr:hypothetical protein BN903_28 [Halorubrum sp. AJ67]
MMNVSEILGKYSTKKAIFILVIQRSGTDYQTSCLYEHRPKSVPLLLMWKYTQSVNSQSSAPATPEGPSPTCFADLVHDIVNIDIDQKLVDRLC